MRRRTRWSRQRDFKLLVGVLAVAAVATVATAVVTSRYNGQASAGTRPQTVVRIEDVAPNVRTVRPADGAATGVFTVDCGTNGNGKFSPDNPVAQPGVKNGAQHVHDFVGNLAITADTGDDALAASDTTCRNGDRSSYFWPVVRVDTPPVVAGSGADLRAGRVGCPTVRDKLPAVPQRAQGVVSREIARLDRDFAEANTRLSRLPADADPARVEREVLGPLRQRRADALRRIAEAVGDDSAPRALMSMTECELNFDGAHAGHGGPAGDATATVDCPTVRDRLPGVPEAFVDQVNDDLNRLDRQVAAADAWLAADRRRDPTQVLDQLRRSRLPVLDRIGTTLDTDLERLAGCRAGGAAGATSSTGAPAPTDTSPAAPSPSGTALPAPSGPDLELPGNEGRIVRPASVLIEYRGNTAGRVEPMPRFLRALTGDAKPTSRGPANARASWSCSGFADWVIDRYPVCPEGSQVQRVHDFPGCWDGRNTDSDNHRSHLAFADADTGACPDGFRAIPQLRITISYDIPVQVQEQGRYALDSFPEEAHNPFSDHDDFVNVNTDEQMRRIVDCVNSGRRCS